MYDVIIIGGGVSGAASARELSRYKVNVCVVEKEEDVCSGTSKANSGIVHSGIDAAHGTLMAKLNVLGSEMMEELSKELDFPYKRNGSIVVCRDKDDVTNLQKLYENGVKNGVKDLKILTKNEVKELEPNIADDGERVMRRKRPVVAPGEMEEVKILKSKLEEYPNLKKITIKIEKE